MTRLAREIPGTQHTQLIKTERIPLTEKQKNNEKKEKFFVAQNTVFTVLAE
jgi:hypothetical protein